MPRTLLSEASPAAQATPAPVEGKPGRFLLQLITPGWGSSGYYSPEVLKAAAEARVFPAGLHSYLDHEHSDGSGLDLMGNRSVKDLASALTEDARWDEAAQALVAETQVFGPYREVLAQMQDAVGLSIRAYAETSIGEAEGRRGVIIDELVEGISADYVTRAGRGGKILQVLESARPVTEARNIGQWVESRIHRDFTILADDMAGEGHLTREERIGLSSAIGDGLAAFVASLEANHPQLYRRDLWDDPQDTVASAIEAAKNVPVNPAGRSTTEESEEDTMPEIAESELRTLREAAGRVETLESERDQAIAERDAAQSERDQLAEANAQRDRAEIVDRIVGEAAEAADVTLDEFQIAGLAGRAVYNSDGSVDESATRQAVDKGVAKIGESRPSGTVRGFGRTTPPAGDDQGVSESDLDALDDAVFGTIQEA